MATRLPSSRRGLTTNEAVASPEWRVEPANADQFGRSVYRTAGGTPATVTYGPELAYAGDYRVLAWVAPESGLSDAVSVEITHAAGSTVVTFDESSGEPGWRVPGRLPV